MRSSEKSLYELYPCHPRPVANSPFRYFYNASIPALSFGITRSDIVINPVGCPLRQFLEKSSEPGKILALPIGHEALYNPADFFRLRLGGSNFFPFDKVIREYF